jgi:hypothetical protein
MKDIIFDVWGELLRWIAVKTTLHNSGQIHFLEFADSTEDYDNHVQHCRFNRSGGHNFVFSVVIENACCLTNMELNNVIRISWISKRRSC